jgi:nitrogen-specific signal transduction histidine kinase/CheY-like chemotaxis protein
METVGTLAGGIAHDFNNILHATRAYLELLHDSMPENAPYGTVLDRVFVGLDRAKGLVDKLLTFSRQEGKTTEEPVDVADVVDETLALAEPSVPDDVQVRTVMPEGCIVRGDPDQLQQVTMNLVTNAAQALADDDARPRATGSPDDAPAGKKVLDIAVRNTHVGTDLAQEYLHLTPGPYVRITVSDSGPGMEADTQERIFEPFFTTKDVDKGTGLGLSVVHGIVQAHDGEIDVYSQPAEGTTFHVYLPAADAAAMDADEAATTDPDARAHILFVDDDAQVRELEEIRLSRLGYEVTTVDHAAAALRHLRDRDIDILITDYLMPEMNGLELTEALRDEGHTVPVLVVSGFSARVSEEDVRAAGAAAFLRKPVGSHELDDALTRVQDAADGA